MDDILVSVLWDNCASVFRPERFTIIKKIKEINKNIIYLSHVSDSKTSKRREVREGFDAHGFAGNEPDDRGISGLDELRVVLSGLTLKDKD